MYGGKWSEKTTRRFSEEEKQLVEKAQVVDSQWSTSCCFFMKNGSTAFIPMSQDAKSQVGDFIDLDTAVLVILEKPGEKDIMRLRG